MTSFKSSKESQLEVLALGYDHYRILRDSAARSEEYLSRVIKRGGKTLAAEFWLELPEPISVISLKDMMNAIKSLTGEMVLKMGEVKEKAEKIVKELHLTTSVDTVLYNLAEAQRQEAKARKRAAQEIEWLERDSKDELSPIFDSLEQLPKLGPDQSYEYVGLLDETQNGAKAIWKIVNTPLKTVVQSQLKPKTILQLRRRPKTP